MSYLFVEVIPRVERKVERRTPVVQEQVLPQTTIFPVADSTRQERLVAGEGIHIINLPVGTHDVYHTVV